jgi:hypothetical protein
MSTVMCSLLAFAAGDDEHHVRLDAELLCWPFVVSSACSGGGGSRAIAEPPGAVPRTAGIDCDPF